MGKAFLFSVAMLSVLFLAVAACAAPSNVKSTPSPPLTPAATSTVGTSTPPPNPDEAKWAKVVDAAKKEGKATLYHYAFTGDVGTAVSQAFQNRYGIKLELISGRGAEFVERLRTEQRMGAVVADVFDNASTHVLNAKKLGLTVSSVDLPVLQEKGVWVLEPQVGGQEGHVLVYTFQYHPLQINSKLVKSGEEPKSYRELLDPKWKTQIIAHDPSISSHPYLFFVPLLENKVVDMDYLQKLGEQKLRLTTASKEAMDMLSRGDAPLSIASFALGPQYISEGAPIRVAFFKEGVPVSGVYISAVKNSPHPNAAKVFLNWLLSPEGQTVQAKARASNGVRKGVDFLPDAVKMPVGVKLMPPTSEMEDKMAKLFLEKAWVPILKK